MPNDGNKIPGSKLLVLVPLTMILLASACNQAAPDTRAADEAAIREADTQWSKIAGTKNLDATVAYYADDAQVLAPEAPIATTKQAIRALWTQLLGPDTTVSWQATKVEVARSGDLGYLTGTYELTMKDAKGTATTEKGKMVEVWKKQPDGKWKVVADIFNSDAPPPPSAPADKKK
jgi:ketosteroid isomerase-like protein